MHTLNNPSSVKQLHKNLSSTQLNQPHLQGSFLNNLQSSNAQQHDVVSDSHLKKSVAVDRPDSTISNQNRQGISLSQGKTLAKQINSEKALVKPSRKKQQYLQKTQLKAASSSNAFHGTSSFIIGN